MTATKTRTRKAKTPEYLAKRGYIPRAQAAAQLRAWADGISDGAADLYIRTPERQPHLWVKLNLQIYFEDAEANDE